MNSAATTTGEAAGPATGPRAADPCAMVIFGAGGDLTRRLVVPALYNLCRTGILPEGFALIGVDRVAMTTEEWRGRLHEMLQSFVGNAGAEFDVDRIDAAAWAKLAASMSYIQGDLTDPALYAAVGRGLAAQAGSAGNAIFYLAVADRLFAPVVAQLGTAGLTTEGSGERPFWRRVVIEKPFGHSLESARALNASILATLAESQIFRIDHFLGKETVQNIMAFRFANGLFEPIWNRDRIDHVQITVAETIGVELRGHFYEATGALRDMVPNHVFSLVALLAMEPPTGFGATAIRDKKAELFAAMPAVDPAWAVRGQYAAGTMPGGDVIGYRAEPDVAADSQVETYAAMRLEIDNWRWAGVPFYIRTGKRMAARKTEIAIRFRPAPYSAFQGTPVSALAPNWLVLHIAPDEGISLQFEVKRPGTMMDLTPARMDFRYADWFPKEPNVGYETLLYDVMIGDPTPFMRADTVEHAWRIVQPVLDAWAADAAEIPVYAAGTDGPAAADALLAHDRDGDKNRVWRPVRAPRAPQDHTA